MNRSETFGNNHSAEIAPDPGMQFGNTHLSFSTFEVQEFESQRPNETGREFAEREMRADERLFMVGLLKAETQGPRGMVEALSAPDFRLKRSQVREFREAIGRMSEEEYGARVNNILGVFDTEEAREAAMDIADNYWVAAKRQAAADDAVAMEQSSVWRTHHEKPRKFKWKAEEVEHELPERPITQAEVMLNNPAKYYREQKQERRGRRFLDKIKDAFDKKFRKEEKFSRRPRSGVEPSDFSDRKAIPTPQADLMGAGQGRQRVDTVEASEEKITSEPARPVRFPVMEGTYHEPVPAGRVFNGTNFYEESQPGQFFGNGASEAAPEVAEEPAEEAGAEPEPYVGKHEQRRERGPLHTNDFSFGEEGAF